MGKHHKKEHKKDRKVKKSKKEKKDKKDSKDKRYEEEPNRLSIVVNSILLNCPKLLDELPAIFEAFNKNEFVQIKAISDISMREGLLHLVALIPGMREHPEYGWCYNKADNNNLTINNFLINTFLDDKIVIEPRQLSESELVSSRSAPLQLLSLIEQFPSIKDEIQTIFNQILDGNMVQLQDLPDEDLISHLEKLLKSLGLQETKEGFGLPSSSATKSVKESVELFCNIFKSYELYQQLYCPKEEKRSAKESKKRVKESSKRRRDSSSSSERSSSSEGEEEESQSDSDASSSSEGLSQASNEIKLPVKKTVGPAMPSREELEKYRNMGSMQVESEEEDDDIGPKAKVFDLPQFSIKPQAVSQQPLGFVGYDDLPDEREGYVENDDENAEKKDITVREEWILNPGESRAYSVLNPTELKNRKFQSGKQAKKLAEKYQIQKAYQKALLEQQEGGNQVIEEEEEIPARPSLMEEHLAKKQKTEHVGNDKSNVRRPFDREKDVLSTKKLGVQEIKYLVENAKELNTKFDKAVVQRTFL